MTTTHTHKCQQSTQRRAPSKGRKASASSSRAGAAINNNGAARHDAAEQTRQRQAKPGARRGNGRH
jgi:hypothetical protein